MAQWQRAAAETERFLTDNPTDPDLPRLRLEIARDRLAWAARPGEGKMTRQALLTEVATRFRDARAELARVVADFPREKTFQEEAQWDTAISYLTEARVIAAVSPTLARGQFVRACELRQVAGGQYCRPSAPGDHSPAALGNCRRAGATAIR